MTTGGLRSSGRRLGRWNFPSCMARGGLNIVVTLGRGVLLGDPRSGIVSYLNIRLEEVFSKEYKPSGRERGRGKTGPGCVCRLIGFRRGRYHLWFAVFRGFSEEKARSAGVQNMERETGAGWNVVLVKREGMRAEVEK